MKNSYSLLPLFTLILLKFIAIEAQKMPNLRENRSLRLPIFAVINILETECIGAGNATGICVKKSKCITIRGQDIGKCGQGYGTCCLVQQACSSTNGSTPVTVQNSGVKLVPGTAFKENCQYDLMRPKGIYQVRLDFESFSIQEGMLMNVYGNCDRDTFTISPLNNAVMGPLCGDLSGQHVYLEYGGDDKISLNIFREEARNQQWSIRVTFIKCNSPELAPNGCLQFFTKVRGTLRSFNHNNGVQINNQEYSACVRQLDGMSRIKWITCGNNTDFQISGDSNLTPNDALIGDECPPEMDMVMIYGVAKYCGTALAGEPVITGSQPLVVRVFFNDVETWTPESNSPNIESRDSNNAGFCMHYQQLP